LRRADDGGAEGSESPGHRDHFSLQIVPQFYFGCGTMRR
jgi:hypothetical protein